MPGDQLAAARARLEMPPEQFADTLNLTVYELEAMEGGRREIPEAVAVHARLQIAEHDHARVMAASGLPECASANRLAAAMDGARNGVTDARHAPRDALAEADEAFDAAVASLAAHATTCATCRARAEYAARHAPPMPELSPDGILLRVLGWSIGVGERLPGALRVPPGLAGEGRRTGIGTAVGLAMMVAVVPFAVMIAASLARGRFADAGKAIGFWFVVAAMYLVGFYLAGCVWDATRALRHRFAGYLLRGFLLPAAIYGMVAVGMAVMDADSDLLMAPTVMLVVGVLGALAGAAMWALDRMRGRLPRRAAR